LDEVKAHDLHNKYSLICVYPTFSHLPWYADHPADPQIRQESYFVRVVVSAVEARYPTQTKPEGHLLVGFSKSGWGAFSLLLRYPELFGRAAAWDAPLWVDRPVPFGMGGVFATQENFEKYQISKLLGRQAELLARPKSQHPEPRLVLLGYDNFRRHHQTAHDAMQNWKIPHVYRDGPQRKHHWQSGWLPEAVECLVEKKGKGGGGKGKTEAHIANVDATLLYPFPFPPSPFQNSPAPH